MKKIILLIVLTLSLTAMAAGGGHGSVADLLYPLLNFVVFAGILIWAVKPKMKNHFITLNSRVQSIMESASKRNQESAVLLAEQEGKLANLDSQVKKLFSSIEERKEVFEKAYEGETQEKIEKLESDATNRINTERKQEVDKVSRELIDLVIASARKNIKNKNQQEVVADKLIKGMQL